MKISIARRAAALLLLLSIAPGCGSTNAPHPTTSPDGGRPDATTHADVGHPNQPPDASVTAPDANEFVPDATVFIPDAGEIVPDAGPVTVWPDGGVIDPWADGGTENVQTPSDYADAGLSFGCPSGDGMYCGIGLGLDPDKLYRCLGGVVEEAASCNGRCLLGLAGEADRCPCPAGDGAYCGATLNREASTLFTCSNGVITLNKLCAAACVVGEGGDADKCPDCPDGDGTYCGGRIGRDPHTLYECFGGKVEARETCGGTCLHDDFSSGPQDVCGACPNGDGDYCGADVVGDIYTLYSCEAGVLTVKEECAGNCTPASGAVAARCAACPGGVNKRYCGARVNGDPSRVYDCLDGTLDPVDTCPGACKEKGVDEDDECSVCPAGDGQYCGVMADEPTLDPRTLYNCKAGVYTAAQWCLGGCGPNDDGTADQCFPECPNGDGHYCGSEVGGDARTLYDCHAGNIAPIARCWSTCPGEDGPDASCGSCPGTNGIYCGASVNGDANTLYNCTDGAIAPREQCSNGCQLNPPGVADVCKAGRCPYGNGLYCGQSIGAEANVLYNCSNGNVTLVQRCSAGCRVNPPGVADACNGTSSGGCTAAANASRTC